MKKRIVIIFIIFLLLTNISALFTIIYQSGIIKKETESEENLISSKVKEELGLSESQAAEIMNTRMSFANELENTKYILNEKQSELFMAIRSEKPDTSFINDLIEEISFLQANLQKEAVKRIITEKSLLGPNQQERYFLPFERRFFGGKMGQGKGIGPMRGKGRGGKGPWWQR
jgi:hypothetical protein